MPQNALSLDGEGLTVAAAHVPGVFTWEAETEIAPEANTALEGLYMSRGMYCTQCEAQGFRKITYWPDRPDVMTTFRVRIEGGRRRCCFRTATWSRRVPGWAEWEDPFRKPSYLFALVAGDLVGCRGPLRHPLGPRGPAADLGAARATRTAAATPWTR